MARSAGLLVRVVAVHGPGATDARRRVADVLLRAANTSVRLDPATQDSPEAPSQRERAPTSDDDHMTDP